MEGSELSLRALRLHGELSAMGLPLADHDPLIDALADEAGHPAVRHRGRVVDPPVEKRALRCWEALL